MQPGKISPSKSKNNALLPRAHAIVQLLRVKQILGTDRPPRASLAIRAAALNANLLLRREGSTHVHLLKTFTISTTPVHDITAGRKTQHQISNNNLAFENFTQSHVPNIQQQSSF
jgi:hypothetical protein